MQTGKARLSRTRQRSDRDFHDQLIDDYLHGDIEETHDNRQIRIRRAAERDVVEVVDRHPDEALIDDPVQFQFHFTPETRRSQGRAKDDRTVVAREADVDDAKAVVTTASRRAHPFGWAKFVAGFAAGGLLGLIAYAAFQVI